MIEAMTEVFVVIVVTDNMTVVTAVIIIGRGVTVEIIALLAVVAAIEVKMYVINCGDLLLSSEGDSTDCQIVRVQAYMV